MSINSKFDDFNKEVVKYLCEKLPKERISIIQEIAAFVACRSGVFVHDACLDRDQYWADMFKVRNSMELEKVKTRYQELMTRRKEENKT